MQKSAIRGDRAQISRFAFEHKHLINAKFLLSFCGKRQPPWRNNWKLKAQRRGARAFYFASPFSSKFPHFSFRFSHEWTRNVCPCPFGQTTESPMWSKWIPMKNALLEKGFMTFYQQQKLLYTVFTFFIFFPKEISCVQLLATNDI